MWEKRGNANRAILVLSPRRTCQGPLGACKGTEPPSSLRASGGFSFVYARLEPGCLLQATQHPRKRSGRSSAINPTPKRLAHSPCSHTAAQAASNAGMRCASSPVTKPASTSPEPAVASQGGALSLMAARPSGAAIDRVGALEDDDRAADGRGLARTLQLGARKLAEQALELALVRRQHHRRLARLDRLEQPILGAGPGRRCAPRSRGPPPSPASPFRRGTNDVSASASSTTAAAEASTVSTLAAVAAPTPAPGPISTALRRSVRQELGERRVRARWPAP